VPDSGFVDWLCRHADPDLALVMFSKGTVWTRAYTTRNLEAWYASGARTVAVTLAFDEELVVLRRRGGGGMMVGGSGSYDVLRFNGQCVSLQSEELTFRRPPAPRHAELAWKQLGAATRQVLLRDSAVGDSVARRSKACTQGTLEACTKAERALGRAVVDGVRTGRIKQAPP
jgi:hypothetical protein